MKKALIGEKVGMTQIFDKDGKVVPVTVVKAGPCVVSQVKTLERDGYAAIQLAFGDTKESKLTKSEQGHLAKSDIPLKKHLKEFPLEGEHKPGDTITVSVFLEGDIVDVTGTSKGKGFTGVIKRHGFGRKSMSHGGGPVHRSLGSIGSGTDPGRVMPGKKMAGHMGAEQTTVLNLEVVKIDEANNIIALRGAVPGPRGGLVYLRGAIKKSS